MRKVFVLLLLSCGTGASAQQITGRLLNNEKTPVPYANVVLQRMDSTFVAGAVSNDKGLFAVQATGEGDYRLIVSYMGYETLSVSLPQLVNKVKLGDLTLNDATTGLDEVQVVASNVTRRIDRQVVLPSQTQLQASSSGYDLLNRLMLPGLTVNPVQNTVATVGGGAVELRINDIKATQAQLLALSPKDVIRVEYIDNPGVRYNDTGVEAVINYVVRRKSSGVDGGLWGMNAVATGFGNDNIYLSVNKGKSEFGIDYYISYRDYDHRHTNEEQHFQQGDGSTRKRELLGLDVPFGYVQQVIETSYNLTEADKYVFNVLLKDETFNTSRQDHAYTIREQGMTPLTSYTHAKDKSHNPSLDLYYQRTLPNRQRLMLNVVGTYMGTDYERDYREYEVETSPLSHYAYSTDGKRYSLIGEGIYRKSWDKTILNIGVKYTQAYTQNTYAGNADEVLNMHNDSQYGYAELQGRLGKLNYMVGAGVSRSAFSQSGQGYSFVTFRPSLSLSHPMGKHGNVRYSFSVSPSVPSLSQLSEIEKYLTDWEVSVGNAGLEPYRRYNNNLQLSWGKGPVNAQLSGYYVYYKNPIMQQVERRTSLTTPDKEEFLYRTLNQKVYHNAGGQLNVRWKVIPDLLSLNANGGINWYKTEGEVFTHEFTSGFGGVNATLDYRSWSFTTGFSTRYNSLWGEQISYGETNSYAQIDYRHKDWRVGLACLYPFQASGWKAGTRQVSELLQKNAWTYIRDNGNMVCISFGWNFQCGRQHQSGRKMLNNADKESGIVK